MINALIKYATENMEKEEFHLINLLFWGLFRLATVHNPISYLQFVKLPTEGLPIVYTIEYIGFEVQMVLS